MLTILMLACTTEEPVESEPLPSEYEWEAPEDTSVEFDPAVVETGLQEAIDVALRFGADPILDGYFAMIEHADVECPTWYEQDGNVFWNDYCTSEDGTRFDGYGFYYLYDQVALDTSATLYDGHYLYGVATVESRDGTRLHMGGGLQTFEGYDPDNNGHVYLSQIQGGFSFTDAEGWLEDGLKPDIYLYAVDYPDYDGRGAFVEGAVGGLTGTASAVFFDNNLLFSAELGSVCEREPTGSIQVRDGDGTWWLVVFDTPEKGDMAGSLCDGCGTVSLNGEEVGQACADFSPWLSWEGRPW